ncbi:lysine transporter, partial [Morganella morganii]|nr:lysine transporter [Morganella morganii]
IMFLLHFFSVKGFVKAEYSFSLFKVSTVILFIVVGVMLIPGIMIGGEGAGWHNWTVGAAPFKGGFAAMIGVAMIVGSSFKGTELIGIAASESNDPAKNLP